MQAEVCLCGCRANDYTNLRIAQSPLDDLESLGYMVVYLLQGSLPWQGLRVRGKEAKEIAVMEKKVDMSPEELCQGLPREIATYMKYVRSLEHERRPDYIMLRGLFQNLAEEEGTEFSNVFDWTALLLSATEQGIIY
jgi:hypothetical protein